MQVSYQITPQGLKYAIASDQQDDKRTLLIFILKQFINNSICFDEITVFYNNDKKYAFRQVCGMLDQQLIKIDEHPANATTRTYSKPQLSGSYVISDMNGLPVDYQGFSQPHALQIAANACDFIRVTRRNRRETQLAPLSIETSWQDKTIKIQLLYIQKFSCLISSKNHEIFNQPAFMPLISCFCKRYNYE